LATGGHVNLIFAPQHSIRTPSPWTRPCSQATGGYPGRRSAGKPSRRLRLIQMKT